MCFERKKRGSFTPKYRKSQLTDIKNAQLF
jgi:hypothetical protein